jgi:uncharacterized protein involved in cysteine biosynthesis
MADISAVFGILLALGIVFPGLLTAWRLLFPATVERAHLRLEYTPWRCFWLGGVLTAMLVVPIVVLLALPFGPAKLAGWVMIVAGLGFASLGAAGLAAKMAGQVQRASPGQSSLGAFVRAAIALELAAAFPVIGWFVAMPLMAVVALGATVFALLHSVPAQASAPATAGLSHAGLPQG